MKNFLMKKSVFISFISGMQFLAALICAYCLYLSPDNYFLYTGVFFHICIAGYSLIKPDVNTKPLKILLTVIAVVFSINIVILISNNYNLDALSIETAYFFVNLIMFFYITLIISLHSLELSIKRQVLICIAIPLFIPLVTWASNLAVMNWVYQLNELIFILLIVFACIFAFFLLRLTIIMNLVKKETSGKMTTGRYIFIIITAIILPAAGLWFNNYMFFSNGLLGDFRNIWFYIIAVYNGIIMLIDTQKQDRALVLLFLKGIGFSYIIYFTVIFCPVIPLGIIGLVFFGLGLLIFLPVTVFVTELKQIIRHIRIVGNNTLGISVLTLGLLLIPVLLCGSFYIDRMNFENVMVYVNDWEHHKIRLFGKVYC